MPIITFDGPALTKEKKEKLIQEFTRVASETVGLPPAAFIVLLKESDPDNVGVGGVMLSQRQKGR
ncbi:MAG: 4-oxalocrotonate tautomerase family protein [Clostridia bacterium]|jgi:4-oxalocrotonate tautomerase|nr:4-oxalocrotonate tautomerase family protein [Clostridia bacterium]